MRDEYDFREGKAPDEVPALAKVQAGQGKTRITIRLDDDVVAWFRARTAGGGNYQSLINEALRAHIQERDGVLERTLRRVLREELRNAG